MKTYLLAAWLLVSRGVYQSAKAILLLPVGPYLLAKGLLDSKSDEDYPSSFAATMGATSAIMSITYAITFRYENRMPDLIGIPAVVCLAQYVLAIVVHFLFPVWQDTIEEAEQMQGRVSAEDEKAVLLRVVGE